MKLILLLFLFSCLLFMKVDALKKGVTWGEDLSSDAAKCQALKNFNENWYYNWDKNPACQAGAPGVEFIPMIWGEKSLPIGNLPAGSNWLLGFNEPNYNGQAQMSPEKAAQLWPQLEATGRNLVGPGVADCGTTNGGGCIYDSVQWYKDFLGNCTGCRVNAAALHLYYCDADDMMNKIQKLYDATGLPVWLTEFACNSPANEPDVVTFAQHLLPRLEASPMVQKYSWFIHYCKGCETGGLLYSSLLDHEAATGTLTDIGEYYSGFVSNNTSGEPTTALPTASATTTPTTTSDDVSSSSKLLFSFLINCIILASIVLLF